MGDHLIPLSESVKAKFDFTLIPATVAGYVGSIPWPTIAAVAATLYTVLRIVEVLATWFRRWHTKRDDKGRFSK